MTSECFQKLLEYCIQKNCLIYFCYQQFLNANNQTFINYFKMFEIKNKRKICSYLINWMNYFLKEQEKGMKQGQDDVPINRPQSHQLAVCQVGFSVIDNDCCIITSPDYVNVTLRLLFFWNFSKLLCMFPRLLLQNRKRKNQKRKE